MGRGRAKAKQTKVARRLKYSTPQTDLEALRQELSSGSPYPSASDAEHEQPADDDDGDYDQYADDDTYDDEASG